MVDPKDPYVTRFRNSTYVRMCVQMGTIAALVVAAVLFTLRLNSVEDEKNDEVGKVVSLLADVCEAASPAELQARGLLCRCQAARTGRVDTITVETAEVGDCQ